MTDSNLAPVNYNMGPKRPLPASQATVNIVRSAVRDVLGPGYTVNVISGRQDPHKQYGSNRHSSGRAVDVQIVDPQGRTLTARQDKQKLLDIAQAASAKGALGVGLGTDYMGARGMHIDQVEPVGRQDHEWGNIGNANAALLAEARQYALMPDSYISRNLPDTMPVPGYPRVVPRPALAPDRLMPSGPVRTTPTIPPLSGRADIRPMPSGPIPSRPVPVAGGSRSILSAFVPSAQAAPLPLPAAPSGTVTRAALAPVGPPPPALQPAPVSSVQRAPLPPPSAKSPGPAAYNPKPVQPDAAKQALAYQAYAQSRAAAPASAYGGPDVRPMPTGPIPAPALSPKEIAAYQQYAASRMAAPLDPVAAPVEVPPVQLPPPLPVLAPKLPAPRMIRNMPVAAPQDVFPSAPALPNFTPADVYAGRAAQAQSASGNAVSRDPYGRTAVTNSYGATTIMTPQGTQSAGNITPGIAGPLGNSGGLLGNGILGDRNRRDQFDGNFNDDGLSRQDKFKRGATMLSAATLGGALAGPVGAALGGLLGKDLALGLQPGTSLRNLVTGTRSLMVTPAPGARPQQMTFAKPNPKLNQFPSAPTNPAGGVTSSSGSNLSYSQMSSISPKAASDVAAGRGGLF